MVSRDVGGNNRRGSRRGQVLDRTI